MYLQVFSATMADSEVKGCCGHDANTRMHDKCMDYGRSNRLLR